MTIHRQRTVTAMTLGALVVLGTGWLQAADPKPYPHLNSAIAYVVDPQWPKRPDNVRWDAMPGIAVDAHDNVWLHTRTESPVQVYDSSGKFLKAWGTDTIQPKGPHHIRIDPDGNVWLADVLEHVVRKFTPEGKPLLVIGTPGELGRDKTHLYKPTDMAFTSSGDVYVSDGYGNARIVHFDNTGKYVNEWGELGNARGQFSIPHAIVADSKDRLYVADKNNARIQVFDTSGKFLDQWTNIVVPWGLWMTRKDELWVAGSSPDQWKPDEIGLADPPRDQFFIKFNTAGKVLQLWGVPVAREGLERPGDLNILHCIAVDSKGNIYAGDIKGKRAQKFVRRDP